MGKPTKIQIIDICAFIASGVHDLIFETFSELLIDTFCLLIISLPHNEKAARIYFIDFSHEYFHVYAAGAGSRCVRFKRESIR